MLFHTNNSTLLAAEQYLTIAAPYLSLGALLLALIAIGLLLVVRRRFARLALGRAGSLEETINVHTADLKDLQKFRGELEQYLKLAESRLRGSTQGVGVVRFNPFQSDGLGGNQSFAIAFLDESHSGVVLSALYARDRVGVYAKPVVGGKSSYQLSQEEQEALRKAQDAVAGHKRIDARAHSK